MTEQQWSELSLEEKWAQGTVQTFEAGLQVKVFPEEYMAAFPARNDHLSDFHHEHTFTPVNELMKRDKIHFLAKRHLLSFRGGGQKWVWLVRPYTCVAANGGTTYLDQLLPRETFLWPPGTSISNVYVLYDENVEGLMSQLAQVKVPDFVTDTSLIFTL